MGKLGELCIEKKRCHTRTNSRD